MKNRKRKVGKRKLRGGGCASTRRRRGCKTRRRIAKAKTASKVGEVVPPSQKNLLSVVRASWTEKDLIPEMANCNQRTVKRWWKKLRVPPDKARRPNTWTQRGAERLLRAWRDWWAMRGFAPALSVAKFSGAPARPDLTQPMLALE